MLPLVKEGRLSGDRTHCKIHTACSGISSRNVANIGPDPIPLSRADAVVPTGLALHQVVMGLIMEASKIRECLLLYFGAALWLYMDTGY